MKSLNFVFAVLLTATTLTYSKPSKAVVGTGGGATIAGLALLGGGYYSLRKCRNLGCLDIGMVMMLAGIVILDGEQKIEFKPVSAEEAARLGLSSAEAQSFNAELDQANLLLEEVTHELRAEKDFTPETAAKFWEQYKDLVNPHTFSAMKKIATQK